MPGLLGIFHNNSKNVDLSLFEKMIEMVSHHEWYEKRLFVDRDNRFAIADINLPIIKYDPQPYMSHDESIKIFLYGEIYNDGVNFLNQLDYIHNLYKKFDLRFVNYLNGSFIIFIVDELRKRILIANDRTASRPLFYFLHNQVLYCAPELKGLLPVAQIKRQLNTTALASFMSCGYLLNGETWINDIKALDNATVLVISEKGHHFIKYWDFLFEEYVEDRGAKYYQNALSELIVKAVRSRIKTSHKYGVLLSGGYDSRAILGCVLQEKRNSEIKTISWGKDENIPYSDCLIAKKLAQKLGIDHTFYKLEAEQLPRYIKNFIYLSDGMTDACVNYPDSLKIFERIRDDLKVDILLRGDECFGWISPAFDERTMFHTLGINPLNEVSIYQRIFRQEKLKELGMAMKSQLTSLSSKINLKKIHNRKDFFYLDQRLKNYLNPLNSVKRIEIEMRNPFIDNNILDFLMILPDKYRIGKNLYVKTIQEMFPTMFTEVAYQPNEINLGQQIKESEELRHFLLEEFSRDNSLMYELVSEGEIRRYIIEFEDIKNKRLLKEYAMRTFGYWPRIYKYLKQAYINFSKRASGRSAVIQKDVMIRRILTVKIWCNLFLNT